MELLRLFVVERESEYLDTWHNWENPICHSFTGPPEAITLMQGQMYPPFLERSLSERVCFALSLSHKLDFLLIPDALRTAIGHGSIDPSAFLIQHDDGHTLLTWIAEGLAMCIARKATAHLADWRALLAECVNAGADLHSIYTNWRYYWHKPLLHSPLLRFTDMFLEQDTWADIEAVIRLWVKELSNAGVDLLQYGRQEKRLHKDGSVTKVVLLPISRISIRSTRKWTKLNPERFGCVRLISFSYGASPQDWHVWYSDPRDEFSGEFWRMVEHSQRQCSKSQIPGSWINDDLDEDCDDDSDEDTQEECDAALELRVHRVATIMASLNTQHLAPDSISFVRSSKLR